MRYIHWTVATTELINSHKHIHLWDKHDPAGHLGEFEECQTCDRDIQNHTGFNLTQLLDQLANQDEHPSFQTQHRAEFLEAVVRLLLARPDLPEPLVRSVLHHASVMDMPEAYVFQELETQTPDPVTPAQPCVCRNPEIQVTGTIRYLDNGQPYRACPRCGRRLA